MMALALASTSCCAWSMRTVLALIAISIVVVASSKDDARPTPGCTGRAGDQNQSAVSTTVVHTGTIHG